MNIPADFSITSFEEIKKALTSNKNNQETNTPSNNKFLPKLLKGEQKSIYKVRILPNIFDKKSPPWVQANVHIFKNSDNKTVYEFCPSTFNAKNYKCPICEFSKFLFKKGDKISEDLARSYWIKKRWFVNVYVKEDPRKGEENQAGKVLIWEFGSKIFDKLVEAVTTHNLYFWHPTDGFDFSVIIKQVSGYQNYDLSDFSRKASPLAESTDEINRILNGSFNLQDVILGRKQKTYEELSQLLGKNALNSGEVPASNTGSVENIKVKEVILETEKDISFEDSDQEVKSSSKEKSSKEVAKKEVPKKNSKDDDIDIDSINFDETPF